MELKFRVWDRAKNNMIYWNDIKKIGLSYVLDNDNYIKMPLIEPTNMYEGDIVRWDDANAYFKNNNDNVGYILYSSSRAGFYWRSFTIPWGEYHLGGKSFTVVGNVFEDKKVLTGLDKSSLHYSLMYIQHRLGIEEYKEFFKSDNICNSLITEKICKSPDRESRIENFSNHNWQRNGRKTERVTKEEKRNERRYQVYLEVKKELEEL